MPKYDYVCEVHGEFEFEHNINSVLTVCPMQCDTDDPTGECHLPVKRLLSPVAGKVVGGTPKHYR